MSCCPDSHSSPLPSNAAFPHDALLHRIANRIRRSLELQEILTTTVAEVRAYLGTDRVKIYQFQPDGHGVVIAESLDGDRLPSLLGLHFPADDIPPYARELYVRARQRTIVNLDTHEIGISPLDDPDRNQPGDPLAEPSDIRYRSVDPCHQEYLTAMGVKASIVVPIVLEGDAAGPYHPPSLQPNRRLWGLLISHHADPYTVTEPELRFIQAVVDQVGVAISHSILLDRVRAQAQQEANINQVTAFLQTSPDVPWQDALQMATSTLGVGGRLYLVATDLLPKEIYTTGEQPSLINPIFNRPIEENLLWQHYLQSVLHSDADQTGLQPWSVEWMRAVYGLENPMTEALHAIDCWVVNDIYQEPLFRTLSPFFDDTAIRGVLIIPLKHGTQILGCLTFFRSSLCTHTLWAGYHNSDTRQLMPRRSFEAWQQRKENQAQSWTPEEVKYAQMLGERFSATVQQYRLFQQVQQLNQELEQRVEERTTQLQMALSSAQMGTWEWDLRTDVKQWSRKCLGLFGVDANAEPPFNRSLLLNLIHPEDIASFQQSFQQALQASQRYECEFRVVWQDQSIHWLYERGNYTYDMEGRPIKLTGICMDITDRKRSEEQLRASLREKEVLLMELHHRVKNNLQVIGSLLRLQSQQLDDGSIQAIFRQTQNRLKSMALVHEQLYGSSDLAEISLQYYLNTLLQNLFESYGVNRELIVATIQAEQVSLPIVTAIPCGLIVNELVSNALKFAFSEGQAGEIRVQMQQEQSEQPGTPSRVMLCVADNGVGLPSSLNLDEIESVGLTIVKALTQQLGGTLTLNQDRGTCFQITFFSPIFGMAESSP